MLAISRALMLRPKLLLLDEPSFGLAPLIVAEIFRILRGINEQDHVSMLLVEQNATWRWTWRTTPTCSRPATWPCPAQRASLKPTRPSAGLPGLL
jgi:ABC-type antimicrobial peptide transport system ATPase subunit